MTSHLNLPKNKVNLLKLISELSTLFFTRYPGYYKSKYPYGKSEQYWHVIAARLAFVFVFQYLVYAITKLVAYIIPDKPRFLELKIKREAYLEKQALRQSFSTGDDEELKDRV